NQIDAGGGERVDHRKRRLAVGIAGDDVRDQRGAALRAHAREDLVDAAARDHVTSAPSSAATVRTSLSPRPLKFTTIKPSGPRSRARQQENAIACADSSA